MFKEKLKNIIRKIIGDDLFWDIQMRRAEKRDATLGYTKGYYERNAVTNMDSYQIVGDAIVNVFKPDSLIDLGCGAGYISKPVKDAGAKVYCFDNSVAALTLAKENGHDYVKKFDVRKDNQLPVQADVLICFEMVEHIPGIYADKICNMMVDSAPIIIMSAARPGQGGHWHVNEQPVDYWIKLMDDKGYSLDENAIGAMRDYYKGGVISDYDDNLLVFRRR